MKDVLFVKCIPGVEAFKALSFILYKHLSIAWIFQDLKVSLHVNEQLLQLAGIHGDC